MHSTYPTFNDIQALLKPEINNIDEAFEFRWLRYTENAQERVFIEASKEEDMIRCTFPFGSPDGRGRIWVKRFYRKLNGNDVSYLLSIALFIARRTGFPVVSASNVRSLTQRLVPFDEVLNLLSDEKI